jgi:hypothetical protein
MADPTDWWYYFKKTEQGNVASCICVVGFRERPSLAGWLSRASSRWPRLSRAKNYKKSYWLK